MVEAGDEPPPVPARRAVLPLAGHVVRRSRGGRTFGAGSTAGPEGPSVAGLGSHVDGEQEPGSGARHPVDGEVPVAESAGHGADTWAGSAPGMVSSSLTLGTSAVVCRHGTDRYHPWSAARKTRPPCARPLHSNGGSCRGCRRWDGGFQCDEQGITGLMLSHPSRAHRRLDALVRQRHRVVACGVTASSPGYAGQGIPNPGKSHHFEALGAGSAARRERRPHWSLP
jgi:hypothetical protein